MKLIEDQEKKWAQAAAQQQKARKAEQRARDLLFAELARVRKNLLRLAEKFNKPPKPLHPRPAFKRTAAAVLRAAALVTETFS